MANSGAAGKRRPRLRRFLLKVHKWAGLTAGAWLLVLGATGIVLDHDEWRWARQLTVPESWISPQVARLLPATKMRHVVVHPDDAKRWLGGSERGLWWTNDGGGTWTDVAFLGLDGAVPQITSLVPVAASLDGVFIATDDGIWVTTGDGRQAERAMLSGTFINRLTPGSDPNELVGLIDHDQVFRVDLTNPEAWTSQRFDDVEVFGLPEHVSLYRFAFDLHFGYGIGSRNVSTWLNDYAGVAFIVLGISGFLFWWFPRRWRKAKQAIDADHKKRVFNWIYRSHAPIVGLLAVLPLTYIAVTAIPMSHTAGFGSWAKDVLLPRDALTPVYRYQSLRGELDDVIAYPNDPKRLSIGTRFGVLHTDDNGKTWQADASIPQARGNLFRVGDTVFFSNLGTHHVRQGSDGEWQPLAGLTTGVTHGVQIGDQWVLKNSRGFNLGSLQDGFQVSDIAVMPALPGATLYLFLIEIHVGLIVHDQFKWVNDLVSFFAILLVLTGPILWWRTKWR